MSGRRWQTAGALTRAALTRAALTRGSAVDLSRVWLFGHASPLDLPWQGFWRADFTSAPWVSVSTNGPSNARVLEEATFPPAAGTTQNGYAPADFDGTSAILRTDLPAEGVYIGATTCTIHAVVNVRSAPAPAALVFDDPCVLVTAASATLALGVSSSGVAFGIYTSAGPVQPPRVALSAGYHVIQARLDGTNASVRVDGGAWTSVAATDFAADPTNVLIAGADYTGAAQFLDALILEVGITDQALTDAELDAAEAAAVTRYALGGGAASVSPSAWSATPTWPGATIGARAAVAPSLLTSTPTWPGATVGSRAPVTAAAWTATPTWPSPTVLGRVVIAADAWSATPTWPGATLDARYPVTLAAWTATPTWPGAVVGSRAPVAADAWTATPTWPSATVLGRAVAAPTAWSATPTWPGAALAARAGATLAAWTATPTWPGPTLGAYAPVAPAAWSSTPTWYAPTVLGVTPEPVVLASVRSQARAVTSGASAAAEVVSVRSRAAAVAASSSAAAALTTARSRAAA